MDNQLRTDVPGIWALGDCNGRGGFTHTSYNDFEIAAGNLLDHDTRSVTDRITAYNLYIDPPLGRAGMTERDARASGRRVLKGARLMTRVARAPYTVMQRAMHIHPTVFELIPTILGELQPL